MTLVASNLLFPQKPTFWQSERVVYLHAEDLAPTWKLGLQKIAEVFLQIIIPMAAILVTSLLLPIKFSAVLLPFFSFGLVFSFAWLFAMRRAPLDCVPISRLNPPSLPLAPLAPTAPRGLQNEGNTCWLNSLTQVIRADATLTSWFENCPDSLSHQFQHASFMPLRLLFSPEELQNQTLLIPPISRLHVGPLRPIEPEIRAEYRMISDAHVLDWIYSHSEIDLIRITRLFSDSQGDQLVPNAALSHLPENQRASSKRNALAMVSQLRRFAFLQEMTSEEKQALTNKIMSYVEGLRLLRAICPVNDGHLVNSILSPNPMHMAVSPIVAKAQNLIQQHPILGEILETARVVFHLNDGERANLLRYLSVIRELEPVKRIHSILLLEAYKSFFENYNEAVADGSREVAASSQFIRSVLHRISKGVLPANSNIQCDPSEAFQFLESIFPPELKSNREVRQIYSTAGLPGIKNCPDGIKRQFEVGQGFLALDIQSRGVNIQSMIDAYTDKAASRDVNELRQEGEDGVLRVYPISREQIQYIQGPKSLWLTIKRHCFASPPDFFHAILPCLFTPSLPKATKIDLPIQLDEEIALDTIEEGIVRYKLDAFLVHQGLTPDSGHYISYKLNIDNAGQPAWYEINDSHVRIIHGSELFKAASQAYFSHYSRI